MDTTPRDLDALLAQAGWAKALARSLVRDPDRAEDLVQRAWLAALRNPPSESTPPRRWLATVMRNLARDDARENSSREQRERAVARHEHGGSDPIEDAATAQARLLAAVRELPEPYRSAVWARYYDGLAPREIAARDGVPVDTVKTRLARGLDALRKRFDREHGGDRGAWIAAFLPLVGDPSSAVPIVSNPHVPIVTTTLTTLAMDAKLKIAAVVAVVVCGTAAWIATREGDVSPRPESSSAAVEPALASANDRVEPETPRESSGAARVSAVEAPAVEPAAAAEAFRAGIVLDLERRPVAGLEIVNGWSREPILVDGRITTSDAHGRFRVSGDHRGYVLARGEGWLTVFATQSELQDARGELCVIVARSRSISGSVVDANGTPVANAMVSHHVAEAVRRGLGEVLRGPVEIGFDAHTDAQGRFALASAPDTEAALAARAENHRAAVKPIPAGPVEDIVVVLPGPEAGSILLRGRVVGADGEGVPRATVGLVDASVKSGDGGHFELPVARISLDGWQRRPQGRGASGIAPLVLRAIHADRLPARLELPVLEELDRVVLTEEFRLELGGAPLAITGRVVDSEGRPIEHAMIRVANEEDFGVIEMEFSGMTLKGNSTVEQYLRGGFAAQPAVSDADGRFVLPGLQPRDYELVVVASGIPTGRRMPGIRAGRTEVEIALDTTGARTKLAGRVVDRRGEPIAGVRVEVKVSQGGFVEFIDGPFTTAGADGEFAFESVRGERFQIEVSGNDVVQETVDVRADAVRSELVVSASRRAFVQVDLGEDARIVADTAQFLDAAGQRVSLNLTRTTVSSEGSHSVTGSSPTLLLIEGRSEVGSTAEGEYVCVLSNAGQEVVRIPVRLGGTGVTIVRP